MSSTDRTSRYGRNRTTKADVPAAPAAKRKGSSGRQRLDPTKQYAEMNLDDLILIQDQADSLRASSTKRQSNEIFYSWWLVLASAVGLAWGAEIDLIPCVTSLWQK